MKNYKPYDMSKKEIQMYCSANIEFERDKYIGPLYETREGLRNRLVEDYLMKNGKCYFKRERGFIPLESSMFFQPSFAGRQYQIGVDAKTKEPILSNGVWFEVNSPKELLTNVETI